MASDVCVGQGANITYEDFATYCPKAIAGIGKKLPPIRRGSEH